MKIVLVALGLAAAGLLGAPAIGHAEPADLVPYCSGNQTPANDNCRARPSQGALPEGAGSGLSPNLPFGVAPNETPVI